jgi:hypothetical protein
MYIEILRKIELVNIISRIFVSFTFIFYNFLKCSLNKFIRCSRDRKSERMCKTLSLSRVCLCTGLLPPIKNTNEAFKNLDKVILRCCHFLKNTNIDKTEFIMPC